MYCIETTLALRLGLGTLFRKSQHPRRRVGRVRDKGHKGSEWRSDPNFVRKRRRRRQTLARNGMSRASKADGTEGQGGFLRRVKGSRDVGPTLR